MWVNIAPSRGSAVSVSESFFDCVSDRVSDGAVVSVRVGVV